MNLSRRSVGLSLAAFVAVPKRLFAAEDPFVNLGRLVAAARLSIYAPDYTAHSTNAYWLAADKYSARFGVSYRGVNGLIRREIEEAIVHNGLADGYWLEVSKRNAVLADEGSLSLRKLERALSIEYGGDWERVVVWHTNYGPIEPWMVAPFSLPGKDVGPQLIVSAKDPAPLYQAMKGWSITGGEGMDALPLSDEYIAAMVRNLRRA